MTTPKPSTVARPTCAPHHWLVGAPITRYTGGGTKGLLVEYTTQVCKHCREERLNECALPEPTVWDMLSKNGWSE